MKTVIVAHKVVARDEIRLKVEQFRQQLNFSLIARVSARTFSTEKERERESERDKFFGIKHIVNSA